jgi:ABC-type polysaccharide/polyol phosphate transport system ATPase subunit
MAHIHLEQVSLTYPIYNSDARLFKNSLLNFAVGGNLSREKSRVCVEALKNIDLALQDGDRLGLIGHNGAGKTTLLKVLAHIYAPTAGMIKTSSQPLSLFDLTMGMYPDLNGYENIKVRGLMLGLTKSQIAPLLSDIEAFSELGDFMKMPLKTYSSGMLLRLGFGLITSLASEILLIDEIVNVGDANFKEKAKIRMTSFINRSNIVVLSTHDMQLIKAFCNKILWLEQGQVKLFGTIDALSQYAL